MGVLTSIAELIAKGFPEEVAKRIASGELPMDEASRVARREEQMVPGLLYRGHGAHQPPTSNDIWWASDSKEMAESYTNRGVRYDEELDDFVDVEGALTPIRTNASKWFEVDAKGASHEDLTANVPGHGVISSTDQIGSMGSFQPGVHGSKITNVVDYYGPGGTPATSYNIRADLPDVKIRHPDAAYDPEYNGPNIMGGALAAGVGLGALSQSEDADAGFVTRGGKTLLEAFHGSPHKFDKFSMDQVGTGEGAQAYGHGLYFADSEDVAKNYRDMLSATTEEMETAVWALGRMGNDREAAIKALETGKGLGMAGPQSLFNDAAKLLREEADLAGPGALYRTEIDVTPESLLDWDKPISEQSEAVRKLAKYHNLERSQSGLKENTGAGLYQALGQRNAGADFDNSSLRGADKHANPMLEDAGIKGIQYLDGDSRAVGDGTSNYVIFDDSLINIAERGNADPRLLAGTAAGTALGALAAPMVKDSGMISSPRAGWLWDTTMALRDVERRLEGNPASLLFPSGLVDYLETTNRREEKPNAETAAWALLDVLPW